VVVVAAGVVVVVAAVVAVDVAVVVAVVCEAAWWPPNIREILWQPPSESVSATAHTRTEKRILAPIRAAALAFDPRGD